MPTYGYRCANCGQEFDVLQRMTDEPVAVCPVCGGSGRRLFFPAGIVFKGSGFYKTDSRKSTGDGSSSSSTAKAGKGSTDSGSDSASTPTAAGTAGD